MEQAVLCEVPVVDAVSQCIVVTCNSAEQPERRMFVLADPDTTFPYCGQCSEAFSCCVLCRTLGHFGTITYQQRGVTFMLCTPCAANLAAFDYGSRVEILDAGISGDLSLRDFCNGEHDNGPWRWDTSIPHDE